MFEIYYRQNGNIISESLAGNRKNTRIIYNAAPPSIGTNIGNPYPIGEDVNPSGINELISQTEQAATNILQKTTNTIEGVSLTQAEEDNENFKKAMQNWYAGQPDEIKLQLDKSPVYQTAVTEGDVRQGSIEPTEEAEGAQEPVGEADVGDYFAPLFKGIGISKVWYKRYGFDSEAEATLSNGFSMWEKSGDVDFPDKFLADFALNVEGLRGDDVNQFVTDQSAIWKGEDQIIDYNLQGADSNLPLTGMSNLQGIVPYETAGFSDIYRSYVDKAFRGNPLQSAYAQGQQGLVESQFLIEGGGDPLRPESNQNAFASFIEEYKPLSTNNLLGSVKNIISSLNKPPSAKRTEQENRWEERFASSWDKERSLNNQQALASAPILQSTPYVLRGETAAILDRLYNRWLTNPNTSADESWLEYVDRNNYFGMIDQPQDDLGIGEETLEKEKETFDQNAANYHKLQ